MIEQNAHDVVHVLLLVVGQHLLDAVVGVADGLEDGLDLLAVRHGRRLTTPEKWINNKFTFIKSNACLETCLKSFGPAFKSKIFLMEAKSLSATSSRRWHSTL